MILVLVLLSDIKTDISLVKECLFTWNIQSNNIIFAGNLMKTRDYYD